MKADAAAIIVAGGQGLRFGGKVRKQYLRLRRRPILWWSLKAFHSSPSIGAMILVTPAEDCARVFRATRQWGFKKIVAVVPGGKTRADSVREGLKALPSTARWVAVHDAVRPLVTSKTIEDTIAKARSHRAAIAACPSKDTVKLAGSGQRIQSSPPREKVWLAQTPQTFERKLLEHAHAKGLKLPVTDDSQLVERLGVPVCLVESPAENIKVTFPEDLATAQLILKRRGN